MSFKTRGCSPAAPTEPGGSMSHVAPIVIAVVALIGSIFSSAVVVYPQLRSQKRTERREAERAFGFYKEPLISAAYDLQSRIYHMVNSDFLGYIREDRWGRREVALSTTAFAFAQYF